MATTATMAAAPDFLEIAGKEYTINPLTIGEVAEMEKRLTRRLHAQVIASARDINRDEGVTHEEAVLVLDRAHKHAEKFLKLSFSADPDSVLAAQVASIYGIALVMSMAIRKAHPDCTVDWVLENIDKETLERQAVSVLKASGFDAVETEPDDDSSDTKSDGEADAAVPGGSDIRDTGPEIRVDGEPS